MTELMVMNLARSLEIIISMLVGAFSCWLGYRLFEIGISGKASLSVKKDKWHFQLLNASPGLFFALFGVAVICFAVAQKTTFDHHVIERNGEFVDERHFEKGSENNLAEMGEQLRDLAWKLLEISSRSDETQTLEACDTILKISPEYAEANNRKATFLLKSGTSVTDALRHAKVANTIQPSNVNYLITLADAYVAFGDSLEARKTMKKASELDPNNSDVKQRLEKLSRQ